MRVPARWALAALLLALALCGAADAPTFPWRDAETREWLSCAQCSPGTFVQQPCRRDSPTTCSPCPPRHYTQFWDYLERCRYCSVLCGEREEEARLCHATHNRACRCHAGFFTHEGFCLEHSRCPPGAGVSTPAPPTRTRSASRVSRAPSQPAAPAQSGASPTATARPCSSHDALCTSCTGFPLSARGPRGPGTEECERAIIDFVLFQDVPVRRLRRLQQALAGPERRVASPRGGARVALRAKLRRRLSELREARDGLLVARLLQALRAARLPGLERGVRERFLPAR